MIQSYASLELTLTLCACGDLKFARRQEDGHIHGGRAGTCRFSSSSCVRHDSRFDKCMYACICIPVGACPFYLSLVSRISALPSLPTRIVLEIRHDRQFVLRALPDSEKKRNEERQKDRHTDTQHSRVMIHVARK